MTTRQPPRGPESRRGADRQPRDGSGHMLRFTPPPEGWTPPDEAGRAILRAALAVKKRREANRKDAA